MAQKIQTLLIDDLDGSEATETVTLGLHGDWYELDLNEIHAKELAEALAPYVTSGRKVRGDQVKAKSARASAPRRGVDPEVGKMRAWARENGYEVSERGRVSASVREAYARAHA